MSKVLCAVCGEVFEVTESYIQHQVQLRSKRTHSKEDEYYCPVHLPMMLKKFADADMDIME